MKPQRFEVGQAITPKTNDPWRNESSARIENYNDPKFGEIYHVLKYNHFSQVSDSWMIKLHEFTNSAYDEDEFDPVISTDALEKELKSISEPVMI